MASIEWKTTVDSSLTGVSNANVPTDLATAHLQDW